MLYNFYIRKPKILMTLKYFDAVSREPDVRVINAYQNILVISLDPCYHRI